MSSDKLAKWVANRERELFMVKQASQGLDDDRPDFDREFEKAAALSNEQARERLRDLFDEITEVRREHRITRWIGADGDHQSVPRQWPHDPRYATRTP
ncbi:hypothetical protein [Gordonia terrae]|uniref:hypothetical protein n=1 Tax=Gordonia terrae TaxID=2055 RepID=UPI003F6CD8AF